MPMQSVMKPTDFSPKHAAPFSRWKDDGGLGYMENVKYGTNAPEIVAGMEWLEKMEEIYEEMKSRD